MTWKEGQRVKLAAELGLSGSVGLAGDSAAEAAVVGSLSLAAGCEGTVERRYERQDRHQSQEVREYVRLKSLLDDFGHQMPSASRQQIAEQVSSLEAEWVAHQERTRHVRVRVRLDNGLVLDDAREDLFTSA
ncbi:hypothetical protein [Streptomyces wuyuanensis]|uniref:hypothetical protein n=1 Tax=Streptomyces wuyuanensis TaxID=1196353 RepID=UPI000B88220A|nr:hypothetical protein [Streptomyces wuyuanensis]